MVLMAFNAMHAANTKIPKPAKSVVTGNERSDELV